MVKRKMARGYLLRVRASQILKIADCILMTLSMKPSIQRCARMCKPFLQKFRKYLNGRRSGVLGQQRFQPRQLLLDLIILHLDALNVVLYLAELGVHKLDVLGR